jgi:hypothetical protein
LGLFALWVVSLFVLGSCASIQPPPGGPEDKTPPEILATSPEQRSLNVPTDTRIRFVFNSPLDRASFQTALTITPYVNGRIEYDWDGYDEVTVILPEPLKENTTYSVSLSRDLKNRRNNTLNEPYQLIFSTGPIIDTAELAGFVFPALTARSALVTRDIFVFGYDITSRNIDTLNFTTTPPDYITQPDERGMYRFLALKPGSRYRVFALQDAFRNRVYDHGSDAYGMPTRDIVLDSIVTRDMFIRMAALPDTIQPMLQDGDVRDSMHLRLRFTEAIDTQSLSPRYFRVRGPQGDIPVLGVFRDHPERRAGQVALLLASPVTPLAEYTAEALFDSIADLSGNRLIDSASRVTITAPENIRRDDTLHMEPIDIADSSRNVFEFPEISIVFSGAVDRAQFEQSVALTDTAGRSLSLTFLWLDDARVTVRPRDTLGIKQFYTLKINTAGVRSPSPLIPSAKDTTLIVRFETSDRRDNGRLTGTIRIADSLWARSTSQTLIVELIGASENLNQIKQLAPRQTAYEFSQVPRGKYRVRAYLSLDGTTRFDPGSIIPWRFAAPNGDFPGEVDVRPRWSVDKVDFDVR